MMKESTVLQAYNLANEQYKSIGVNVNDVLDKLDAINLSVHCWQTDDVAGFEDSAGSLGNGLAVTGNYPGKSRNIHEMRSDLEKV